MQDDKSVSEVRVVGDHLLAEPNQIIENPRVTPSGEYAVNTNHVCAIIHVTVRQTKITPENKLF